MWSEVLQGIDKKEKWNYWQTLQNIPFHNMNYENTSQGICEN